MTTVDGALDRSIAGAEPASAEVRRRRSESRAKLLKGFVLGAGLIALGYTSYQWGAPSDEVSTDDAYVGVVFAQVTPEIDGRIDSIRVEDTQYVGKGDVLATLDPEDAQLDFDTAKEAYDEAFRRVRQEVADTGGAESNVLAKRSLLELAQQQLRRRKSIPGVVSAEELSNSQSAAEAAKYAVSLAEQELTARQVLAENSTIDSNPEILSAKINLEKARLRLERTSIRAPVDGIISQSRVQIGQQIAAGTALMTIVPIKQLFVDANFKESQIKRIRPGQLATLTSDIYGPEQTFHGYVEGVGGGTGATFAVIPPQNATGNWIKVVQRLPVRIALYPDELEKSPLRAGISMTVAVHLDRYIPVKVRKSAATTADQKLALRRLTTGAY